mmetsp:Transcript_25061/g.81003  ORF Transcript_25061/g.81003 Transcript_25061/m.81003 type:complete len:341 (-) Transcript_25061:189-1211(-)
MTTTTTTTQTTMVPKMPQDPSKAEKEFDLNPLHWLEACKWHFTHGTVNYPMGIYITLVHAVAAVGLCYVRAAKAETLIWAFALWPMSGLGITAGVHRLWSHRSYKAGKIVRCFLMVMNSIANQGSIMHWARDHRVHHKHSETDADPHNATRGFFFAHMGWLYVKKHPAVLTEGRKLDYSDLEDDGFVMFQKRTDPWFAFFCCFVMPALVASRCWAENFWTAFFVAGFLRYVIVLHFTWLVNSAAHFFGDRPYDESSWPAENAFVSWCAAGEGWHNWHHRFPYDYAASEFGISSQFNITKLFIDSCAALGLVWDLKRANSTWERMKERRHGVSSSSSSKDE